MTIGSVLVILVAAYLVWFGLAGYEDWDLSQRVPAVLMGLAGGIGFSLLLALILRQQVAGLPRVRATHTGLEIGTTVIPWAEIDEVVEWPLFWLPHVAMLQRQDAPRRLRGLRSLQYMPVGSQRVLFVAERQLGTDLESSLGRIRDAISNADVGEEAPPSGLPDADHTTPPTSRRKGSSAS